MSRALSFQDGGDTLRQYARPAVVGITLAKHAPILTVLMLPPAIWAFLTGETTLGVACLVPSLVGALSFAAVYKIAAPSDLRRIEAIVTVALVFALAALSALPAFMSLGMTPIDAGFEAMSGITTTGLSVAQSPDAWPNAAHFLRAWLQWIGGLVMATAVLALILPSGLSARRLGQAGMDEKDPISSTRRQAQQLLGVYVGITVLLSLAASLVLPNALDALFLVMSGLSTGGFAPRSDSLESYSTAGQMVVLLSCLVGAISLLTFIKLLQGRWREAWALGSVRRVVISVAVLCAAAGFLNKDGDLLASFIHVISAVTSAGFSAGPMPIAEAAIVLLIVAMLMGGDVGSTAGGLKLARIGLLARAVRFALRAPALPDHAVSVLRHEGREVRSDTLVAILALVTVYTVAALLLWSLFLGCGYAAGPALFDTISALSTVGLSAGAVGPDIPSPLKLALTAAMWLGRLEFIAVLVLFTPRTWNRKG